MSVGSSPTEAPASGTSDRDGLRTRGWCPWSAPWAPLLRRGPRPPPTTATTRREHRPHVDMGATSPPTPTVRRHRRPLAADTDVTTGTPTPGRTGPDRSPTTATTHRERQPHVGQHRRTAAYIDRPPTRRPLTADTVTTGGPATRRPHRAPPRRDHPPRNPGQPRPPDHNTGRAPGRASAVRLDRRAAVHADDRRDQRPSSGDSTGAPGSPTVRRGHPAVDVERPEPDRVLGRWEVAAAAGRVDSFPSRPGAYAR